MAVTLTLFNPLSKRGYDPAFLFLGAVFCLIALFALPLSRVGKGRTRS
jgi:hypothetical protein